MAHEESRPVMLIVDDVEINRVILTQIFESSFTIAEAADGKEAKEYIESCHVDVVMLDLVMPVMDGFGLLEWMKGDERFSSIPVIVTTARSEVGNEVHAMEMGASDFITKPYNPTIVRCRVKNAMARVENEWRKAAQSEQSHQISEMKRRIELDALTGIFDRESFYRRAAELMQQNSAVKYAIVYLDINFFKVVNDLFRIDTGNHLLKQVAAFFHHMTDEIGRCGRLEADHFALCLPLDELDMDVLINGADGIVHSLGIPNNIRFYAGVYPVTNVFQAVDQMCDRAHLAMNTIKGNFTKRYAYYDEKMRAMAQEEQTILRDMETALSGRQFCIFVQPIYSVSEERDVSGEVLVRWFHPTRNMISPGVFIPIFERNGFIVRLDRFVWEEACRMLAREKKEYGHVVPVSVNLSRLNFYDEELMAFIQSLIEKYELEPWMLKLEITESAYTDNPHQIIGAVSRFRQAGFSVLMDDFGSGYSSLNMLRDMPVDILKLDMRFIENVTESPRAAAIVKNIVNLARDIDMDIVVEGVETKEQVDFLSEIGCDSIQGYFFSRPLPQEDYLKRLSSQICAAGGCHYPKAKSPGTAPA